MVDTLVQEVSGGLFMPSEKSTRQDQLHVPTFTLDKIVNDNERLADHEISQLADYQTQLSEVINTSMHDDDKTYSLTTFDPHKGDPSRFMKWVIEWYLQENFPFIMKRYDPQTGVLRKDDNSPYLDGQELACVKGMLFAVDGFGITEMLKKAGIVHRRDVPKNLFVFHEKEELMSGYLKQYGNEDGAHIIGWHSKQHVGRVGNVTKLMANESDIDFDKHLPDNFILRVPLADPAENGDYVFVHSGNRTRAGIANAKDKVHTYMIRASAYGVGGKISHHYNHDLVEEYFQIPNLDRDPIPSIHPDHPIVGVYRAYHKDHKKLVMVAESYLDHKCPAEMFR